MGSNYLHTRLSNSELISNLSSALKGDRSLIRTLANSVQTIVRSLKLTLTDLVLDLVGHTGHLVEQTQRLIHPLIDHT